MPSITTATPTTRRATTRREPTATATATPPPVVMTTLSPRFYGTRTAPADETCTTADGLVILRVDSVQANRIGSGPVYHRDSEHILTCPHCATADVLRSDCPTVTIDSNRGESQWCPDCVDNDTWSCADCDRHVSDHVPRAFRDDDEDHEEPLCPRCAPRSAGDIWGRLLNYSSKAVSAVPPRDKNSMLYGLEVETHVRNNDNVENAIRELHKLMGPGYYVTKSDGSLINGFEIVTRPDSMRVHREQWLKMLEAIQKSPYLKEHLRAWSAPNQCCGIHCHIDKSMLSQMQLGKLNVWLNHKDNRSFIEKVAGRGSNSYTSFSDSVKIIDGRRLKSGTSPERYVALNVQNATAEMRIFRSTLYPPSFFRILDFVEASVEWTGLANCSTASVVQVPDFVAYVLSHKARFPNLSASIIEWDIKPNLKMLKNS